MTRTGHDGKQAETYLREAASSDALTKGRSMTTARRYLLAIAAVMLVFAMTPAASGLSMAAGNHNETHPRSISRAAIDWWWLPGADLGSSKLVRTGSGLTARFGSSGQTPGDAVTLWLIIFNNPDACSTSPCSVPADVFNYEAGADFYWGDGAVVGSNGKIKLRGSLGVGQTAFSGKAETGLGEAVALSNPFGAEVVLAVHSHGPAATGEALDAQLTSFTGGCATFNGPNGFAAGFADLPDAPGECSTFQRSLHQ